ncbi:MAG: TolC family protein, partial [Gemmataceae bacterium]
VLAGYSSGTFGGGSNLVAAPNGFQGFKEPYFGSFAPREDIDVVMYWTAQNMGMGNLGRFRVARADRRIAELELIRELNRVRDEVAVAYARIHANYAQIDIARRGMESAQKSYKRDYEMITQRTKVLPIELLNSYRLLAAARMEYLDAVVNYDSAQFALYVALGQPPPNNFAHEIPNNEDMPTKPHPAPPLPGCVPPGGGPATCIAAKAHP